MKVNRLVSLAVLIAIVVSTSGCLSLWSIESTKRELTLKKAILSNNEQAIKAIRLGDNGVGFGINVLNWEAIQEHPVRQTLAAIGDAGLAWAAYEGAKSITGDNSGNEDKQESGRDSNKVEVNGDGNNVHIGDENTTPVIAGE